MTRPNAPKVASRIARFFRHPGTVQAVALTLASAVVMLGALALRTLPLAEQLWHRPDLAATDPQAPPLVTAMDKVPVETPFVCC